MSKGEFYELHARLHRGLLFGKKYPAEGFRLLPGEPWLAARVTPALKPFGKIGYLWYGSPLELKLLVGGGVLGGGAAVGYALWPDDEEDDK